jgi:hypothetical protein
MTVEATRQQFDQYLAAIRYLGASFELLSPKLVKYAMFHTISGLAKGE